MTYEQWASHHAAIFNLNIDTDDNMLAAWIKVFQSCGYSVEELFDATDQIAASTEVPETRLQQLGALHATIRSGRLARQSRFQGPYTVHHVCTFNLCDGVGWLTVPHPKSLENGQWIFPWYTCAVLCSCDQGKRVRQTFGAETTARKKIIPAPLSLEAYQRQNPFWRDQLVIRAEQQKQELQAIEATKAAETRSPGQKQMASAFDDVVRRLQSGLTRKAGAAGRVRALPAPEATTHNKKERPPLAGCNHGSTDHCSLSARNDCEKTCGDGLGTDTRSQC
jgi:hypothetical protein